MRRWALPPLRPSPRPQLRCSRERPPPRATMPSLELSRLASSFIAHRRGSRNFVIDYYSRPNKWLLRLFCHGFPQSSSFSL